MCGIIGYIGSQPAAERLLDGLGRLEYRGYDSAGIATADGGALCVTKCKGRIGALRALVAKSPHRGTAGIGHTRWATHGEPSDVNSHPHVSSDGAIALVHNGIIENYLALKSELVNAGHSFVSRTDSEVAANLVAFGYKGDLVAAVRAAVGRFRGTYAIAAVSRRGGEIVAACKDSPVVIGRGADGVYLASDLAAIAARVRESFRLGAGQIARLTADGVSVTDCDGAPVEPVWRAVSADAAATRGDFDSFMHKEIFEIPTALARTLAYYDAHPDALDAAARALAAAPFVRYIGCGTAYHACLGGRVVLDRCLRVHAEVEVASEFRYRDPAVDAGEVCIFVSQSGETADTLAALRLARARGALTVAVTNVPFSTITALADIVLPTLCGPEIAVASTKAYNAQLLVLYLLALRAGEKTDAYGAALAASVRASALIDADAPAEAARLYADRGSVFFVGRGQDCAVAREGALKLKEITYVPCQAYPAGELKHGALALIETGSLVVVVATRPELADKTANTVAEVRARGATVMGVGPSGLLARIGCDTSLVVPDGEPLFAPLYAIVPLQLFAYRSSLVRGTDADKPRNLAKSVTVE